MTPEQALRKIKEITGVSEVDDIMRKFSNQNETARNLHIMTTEAQARIDALTASIEVAKAALRQHKYSAATTAAPPVTSAAASARRLVDELEAQLLEATAKYERLQQRQERLAKLLVSIRSGSEHLMERLEPVRCEMSPAGASAHAATAALRVCDAKLRHALHDLRDDDLAQRTALSDASKLAIFTPLSEESQAVLPAPLRVDHLPMDDGAADDDEDECDDTGPDNVVDRSFVKTTAERRGLRRPAGHARAGDAA
jgi:chromosome segregation ATPase